VYSTLNSGLVDAFVAVVDASPTGNFSLLYISYLGGLNNDIPWRWMSTPSLHLPHRTTTSTDFPTVGPFQSTGAASSVDAFVVKLDPNQLAKDALVFSSYLGGTTGNDSGNGIAVDSRG